MSIRLLKLIDIFFLSRPLLLVPVWGFCIFGYYHGRLLTRKAPIGSFWTLHSMDAFLWFVLFSFSVASVYIFNQIADIEVDKANRGLPLLAKGKVSVTAAKISACIFAAIGVMVPIFKHPFLSVCACAAIVLGLLYSCKPIRLSGRFCFDFLSNAAGYGIIAFGVGWSLSGAPLMVAQFPLSALSYFLLMCAGSISSTIPDYHGDRQHGKHTTAVVLGVTKAHILATILLCLAMANAFLTNNNIALICALCALPFYVFHFIMRDPRIGEATYKIGGFLCMIMASILMPLLACASMIVVALTLIYFKKRHHIIYPSLVPVTHEE